MKKKPKERKDTWGDGEGTSRSIYSLTTTRQARHAENIS